MKYRPQMFLRDGQLLPVTAYDAEKMDDYKEGQTFNLHSTGKRSNPHHNLYWSALRRTVKATDMWPTEAHLHHELKLACGYYKTRVSPLTGEVVKATDSISFDDMSQNEFHVYFERSMEKLAEAIGYDPLDS